MKFLPKLTPFQRYNSPYWLIDFAWLITLLVATYTFLLGTAPLAIPDGARYAEIAREMVRDHQYLIPHLNGVIYLEKPPLFYWLTALAIHTLGYSEWALRSVDCTLAILGCLVNYVVGYLLFNRRVAILASLVLASSILHFSLAHVLTTDVSLSFWLCCSLYCILLWLHRPQQTTFLYSAYALAGLALMTKSLIGLVFPAMIIGLWTLITGNWQIIPKLRLVRGLLITFAIAAPWHVLLQMHQPDFLHFFFVEQQFLRYATDIAGRYQPFWFFFVVVLVGFFPWICFLPQTLCHVIKSRTEPHYQTLLYLLIWVLTIFSFFSLSQSKLIPYISPIMMPMSLLVAHYLETTLQQINTRKIGLRFAATLLLIISLALIATLLYLNHTMTWPNPIECEELVILMIVTISLMTAVAYCQLLRSKLINAITTLLIGSCALLLTLACIRPLSDPRPIKTLAVTLKPLLKPDDAVVSFDHYYQDLPYYLDRRVIVVDWINELDYGYKHQDLSQWLIKQPALWRRWRSSQRMYMIASLQDAAKLPKIHPDLIFTVIAKTTNDVLLTNKRTW